MAHESQPVFAAHPVRVLFGFTPVDGANLWLWLRCSIERITVFVPLVIMRPAPPSGLDGPCAFFD